MREGLFFFNDTATTEIYTLSLHDALPILNQEWIMDPKKKVIDVLKEAANKGKIEIIKFVRFKVGEGI